MQVVSRHHVMIGGTLLLPALLIGLLSTAAFLLNHSRLHDLLVQQLETQLGIEVSRLRLQLFPIPTLEVSDLVVRDSLTAEPSLRAGRASLSVRLWPLATKRVALLTLEAAAPEVAIRRDGDGRWHIPLIDVDETEAPRESSPGQWSLTDVVLQDGTLRIFDPTRLNNEGIAVHHVQAVLHSDPKGTRADVSFRGATDDGGNLNLSGTLAVSDQWHGSPRKQFNGALHFHNWNFAYWLERAGVYTVPHDTKDRGRFSAKIRLDVLENSHGFNLFASEMAADTGWLTIRGQMLVGGAGTEHPVYAMALSTSPMNSRTLFARIPSSWLPQNIRATVDEHQLAGTIEVQSLELRGRMDIFREPDEWRVIAKVVDASASWDRTTTIRQASGTVFLDRTHGELTDVIGDIDGVRLASDKLTIADIDLIPRIDGRLNAYGEVERVMAVLNRLTPGTEAHRVVKTIGSATGRFRMTVHVAGPLMPNPSFQLIKADIRLEDAGAALSNGVSVGGINGVVEADSRMVTLRDVSGVFQGIRFQANGSMDLEAPRRNNVQVAMSSDGRAIEELVASHLPSASGLRLGGAVRSTMRLSGSPTAVHCEGVIDVTHSDISASMLHKQKGVPGFIEWNGTLFDKTRVLVDRLRLGLSNSEIHADGELDLTHGPRFRWRIQTGDLSVNDLVESGMTIPISEGVVQASAVVRGEGTDWQQWLPSGSITIRRGVMTLPAVGEKFSDVNGRVRFSPQGVALDNVSLLMGEADVKVTGTVEQWRSHPRARLLVESSHLNVSTLLPAKVNDRESAGIRGRSPDWMRSTEATITFLVKQLRYERLLLKTVSGELRVNSQKAAVHDLRAETSKGTLSGRLEAQFAPEDQIDLAAYVSVDGMPAEHILVATGGEHEHLQGDVSVDGALHARIDSNSPLKSTLTTGPDGIVVKVKNGRLHQDPVLTKALKILNLPAVIFGQVDIDHGGIPFDSLSARVTALNGVFTSQDIVFDGPVIKVAGAGSADVTADGLDLAVAVSPVASYSDLLAKIPLLGPVIIGDHSGLTTAVFQAKGSLGSPEIVYLPLVSLARGVSGYPRLAIEVLANAIKLPPTALAYLGE